MKGVFDPLNFSLHLETDDPVDIGNLSAFLKNNPTAFHEIVHSYQLFGTTSGVLTGAICPVEAALMCNMLDPTDRPLTKPLIPKSLYSREVDIGPHVACEIDSRMLRSDPRLLSRHIIFNDYFLFESLNAMLDDPGVDKHLERRNERIRKLFTEDTLAVKDRELSISRLLAMVFVEFNAQFGPVKWPAPFDPSDLIALIGPTFVSGYQFTSGVIGMFLIHEGQAQFAEIQLIASGEEGKRDLAWFKGKGYLTYDYVSAFEVFTELSGLGTPARVLDWRVHLFQVVCDYAMNPTIGYLSAIKSPERLLEAFCPGERFRHACQLVADRGQALKKLGDKYGPEFTISHEFMAAALSEINDADRAPMTFAEAVRRVAPLAASIDRVQYNEAMPFCFLFRRHINIMEHAASHPMQYLSPLAYVLDNEPSLHLFLPPTITTRKQPNFITVRRKSALPARGMPGAEAFTFYMEQVFSDLCRQLLTEPGAFSKSYDWIPSDFRDIAIEGGQRLFEEYLGVRTAAVVSE